MGDPKKLKKQYSKPMHPWNKTNIEVEGKFKKEYGLKNKKEIYVAQSFLKKYRDIAKRLIASRTEQSKKESAQVLEKLEKLGLLPSGSELDQILNLELPHILNRRIQSMLVAKGFARTPKQARQFITHQHIMIGDKKITSPSYILSLEEESTISFAPLSTLHDENHPERVNAQKEIKEEAESVKPKKGNKKPTTKTDNEDNEVSTEEVIDEVAEE